jgi:hypothetical protein
MSHNYLWYHCLMLARSFRHIGQLSRFLRIFFLHDVNLLLLKFDYLLIDDYFFDVRCLWRFKLLKNF